MSQICCCPRVFQHLSYLKKKHWLIVFISQRVTATGSAFKTPRECIYRRLLMDFMVWQGMLHQQQPQQLQLEDSPRPILNGAIGAVYEPQKTQIFSELFTCSLIQLLFDSIAFLAMVFRFCAQCAWMTPAWVRVFGISDLESCVSIISITLPKPMNSPRVDE